MKELSRSRTSRTEKGKKQGSRAPAAKSKKGLSQKKLKAFAAASEISPEESGNTSDEAETLVEVETDECVYLSNEQNS
jgi:hypothetical protein